VDGYGADDLAFYKAATGKTDWPRNPDGTINIDDSSIGNWRSAALGQFLGKAAAQAHQYGKQLFLEVGVSVNNLSLATNNYGTNYAVMLNNVDKIVVQDYFGVGGYSPKYSSNIAQYLAQIGAGRSILELGLWGASGTTVSATDLKYAITTGQSGGISDIMVVPESLALSTHWNVLDSLWGASPAPTNTPTPTATNLSKTNTPKATATKTSAPTASNTPKPTSTNTSAPTATNTPKPTATKTAAPTATRTSAPTATNMPTPGSTGVRAISVEYANYATSRSEVPTWVAELKAAGINEVAISAGRAEWTYFKWAGHTANQSNDVTSTGIDFLAQDSATFNQFAKVSAVVDVFAPNTILANPSKAAINALGQPDPNLVSTSELVNGAFGQQLLDMVQYIAANYPYVDSIDITELSYRVDGYGPDDTALFKAATGKSDWPRNSDGSINIDDPVIGNWRSAVIGQWLGRATALAHQYGKKLYMDVSVSYGNLGLMTNNMGTNYNVMLQNSDMIVAWDYFSLAGYPASYSQNVGQYLATFGFNRAILSVGLWGANNTTVSPADLQAGVLASQAGGMPNVWICPGSMMTAAHWQVLNNLWGPK
jgi:cell division septation protein DedD